MNPFKWTNAWIYFFSYFPLLSSSLSDSRLSFGLAEEKQKTETKWQELNDDHMFEILQTVMTQLAIASELTCSHYLLIHTHTETSITSPSPICSRNLFAMILPHEQFEFFFSLRIFQFSSHSDYCFFVVISIFSLYDRSSMSLSRFNAIPNESIQFRFLYTV